MTLGGSICIRNGLTLDYCFQEAIRSLLGACDVVSVCDIESTDGTQELLREWCDREPRLKLCVYPWTDPRGSTTWWPDVLNYGRQHLTTDHFIHLDADEVIHEEDRPIIRASAESGSVLFCRRLNFWRDAHHLIPEGFCCGVKVLRIAPTHCPIPSDYPWAPASETIAMATDSPIRIFHYGFLRKDSAFFQKAKTVQRIWVNDYDPRLVEAEKFPGNWMEAPGVTGWENKLTDYPGDHPEVIKQWLIDRNRL